MRTLPWILMFGSSLSGCETGETEGEDVLLLAVLPYTGKWEDKGVLHENAVRMALEELIADGIQEARGRRFKVVTVNSGDGIDVVEQALNDIVEGPDGDRVLGILSSTGDAHEGAARVSAAHGIPHFETSNGASEGEFLDLQIYPEEGREFLLSSRALCNHEAAYTAQFIMNQYPNGKVALIRGDEDHDRMHTAVVRAELEAAGFAGTLISSDDPALAGEEDPGNRKDFVVSYGALNAGGIEDDLGAIVSRHSPDVIFFHVRGETPNLRFLQDSKRVGFQGGIATCGMARTNALIDPNENGLISDYLVGHDGVAADRFHFMMRGPIPSARLDAFKDAYQSRFGSEADTFTPAVYDAAMLWALGVLAAGTDDRAQVLEALLDTSRGGELVSRDDTRAMIDRIADGEDVDYDGASGSMDLRDDRTVPGYYYVERVIKSGSAYKYEKLALPEPVVF